MMKSLTLPLAVIVAFIVVSAAEARPGGHGPPPQEALDACAGKSAGDECSFAHNERQMTGTCFTPKENLPLACRPARQRRERN